MDFNTGGFIVILVFLTLLFSINYMKKLNMSFNTRVITALLVGLVFGAALQLIFGYNSETIKFANSWIGVVGSAYVRLLRMIVIPLIFVSIVTAIIKQDAGGIGKKASRVLAVLLITTAIAAFIGVMVTSTMGLTAEGLQSGTAELERGAALESKLTEFQAKTVQEQLIEIIPVNPFYAMTGEGSNATLATVFFASMLGIAALKLNNSKPESADRFKDFMIMLHDVVMRLVQMVLRLTPYGVLALMTRITSTSNYGEILRLIGFVGASYAAIFLMFIVHGIILAVFKVNPIQFYKKSVTNLLFAFTSRSSAGTLPITVSNMVDNLGVDEGTANLAGSLGTSIGQNGCAGIYPAMLAAMIAPTLGINPIAPVFLIKLIIITAMGSFGIAGVGGGATFAALTVLSAMGLPVELAGLLVAIEPLIDMGRTALNVNDSLLAGVVTAKSLKLLDEEVFNSKEIITE